MRNFKISKSFFSKKKYFCLVQFFFHDKSISKVHPCWFLWWFDHFGHFGGEITARPVTVLGLCVLVFISTFPDCIRDHSQMTSLGFCQFSTYLPTQDSLVIVCHKSLDLPTYPRFLSHMTKNFRFAFDWVMERCETINDHFVFRKIAQQAIFLKRIYFF